MRKCHDVVTDELELRLELGVLHRQPLLASALPPVVPIVRSGQASRVATLEMVFPKLWNEERKVL